VFDGLFFVLRGRVKFVTGCSVRVRVRVDALSIIMELFFWVSPLLLRRSKLIK
jgi:hypothetical protein